MSHRGLLLTMTEPPGPMDEEFNAWYDDEHLPQVRHFTASVGVPRHIALAELAWDGTRSLPAPQPGWFMRLYRAYGS